MPRRRPSIFFAVVLFLAPLASVARPLGEKVGTSPLPDTNTGHLTGRPSIVNFGKIDVGETKTLSATLTNSGLASVTISKMNDDAAGFNVSNLSLPVTLAASQSKTVNVTFAPQSAGVVSGNIEFISNAGNSPLTIYLQGVGVQARTLTATPRSLDFGSLQVGNSKTLRETLTNTGNSRVRVSQAAIAGAGFSMSGLNPPLTLTAGQSFTFNVTFAPKTRGDASGTLSVVSDAPNPVLTIPLSGKGTAAGQLTVAPASVNLGNVAVGTSKSQAGTLYATGSGVTVLSATGTSPEFTVAGLSFPFTIEVGKSASFTVTFAPQKSGVASSSISFVSNASNSPTIESVTGTGTPAPPSDPLGTVTGPTAASCAGTSGSVPGTCETISIAGCTGGVQPFRATLKITTPRRNSRGTIILMSSNDSAQSYDMAFTLGPRLINNLVADGFTAVQLMTQGWWSGGSNPSSIRALACKPVTAIRWIYDNVHRGDTTKPMCGTGNSGGGAVFALAVSHYALGSILSEIELTSGPPLSRLDWGCLGALAGGFTNETDACGIVGTPEYESGQKSGIIDPAFGGGHCAGLDRNFASSFMAGGTVSNDSILDYPTTDIHIIHGSADKTSAAKWQGMTWYNAVTSKKANACVASGHAVASTTAGEAQIENDLKTYCVLPTP